MTVRSFASLLREAQLLSVVGFKTPASFKPFVKASDDGLPAGVWILQPLRTSQGYSARSIGVSIETLVAESADKVWTLAI